jgi:hypothetical protein
MNRLNALLLAICMAIVGLVVLASPASAGPAVYNYGYNYGSTCSHFIQADGTCIKRPGEGFRLDSANGADRLVFQSDANLVGYNNPGTTHWLNTQTAGWGSDARLELQGDCNVVIYSNLGSGQAVLWSGHANSGNVQWGHCSLTLNGNNSAYVTIYPPGKTPFISSWLEDWAAS